MVELGSRSLREPFTVRPIRSALAEQYSDSIFSDDHINVPSVNPERTFLEKLFLLHEEFQRPSHKIRVDRLSRHLYDIHQINQTQHASLALTDLGLFKSIVEHRKVYTYLSGINYTTHYPPHLDAIPPEGLQDAWAKDYATMQKEMIYEASLDFNELLQKIKELLDKINGNTPN